jgi:glycerophosphoryl diester phosphodiesterase
MRALLVLLLSFAGVVCGQTRQVMVISHRGEHLHHPENTMPAYRAAFEAGADFIEVDVRTTADGKLVLMHNDTVDARTNGSGAVKDMTFEQIRALDAGAKSGQDFTGTRVPTFDEALEFAHGNIGIYVDTKRASAADVVAAIERQDMQDHVVIYGGYEYLKQVASLRPKIKVMPESVSVSVVKKLIDELKPKVIAFSGRDFTDEIIGLTQAAKADIYVDRLGDADRPDAWQDAVDRGATGIQTDHPAELVQYLRSKGYHK